MMGANKTPSKSDLDTTSGRVARSLWNPATSWQQEGAWDFVSWEKVTAPSDFIVMSPHHAYKHYHNKFYESPLSQRTTHLHVQAWRDSLDVHHTCILSLSIIMKFPTEYQHTYHYYATLCIFHFCYHVIAQLKSQNTWKLCWQLGTISSE